MTSEQAPPWRSPFSRFTGNCRIVWRRLWRAPKPRLDWPRLTGVVAAALVLIVVEGLLLDAAVARRSQALPEPMTGVFQFLTQFGRSDWWLIPSGLIMLVVAFGDWRRPVRAVAAAWAEIGAYAGTFFVAIALPGIVADVIKPLVGRVRPGVAVESDVAFAPFTLGYAYHSFPSGHANTMAALAVAAVATFGARALPIVLATMVVAMSRVVIGVHYLSDVVAGILLGGALAWLVVRTAAGAGFGFTVRPSGANAPRLDAARRVLARPGGTRRALAGLGMALTWRGPSAAGRDPIERRGEVGDEVVRVLQPGEQADQRTLRAPRGG